MPDFDLGDFETIELTAQDGHIAIEGHGRAMPSPPFAVHDERYVWALADKVWIDGSLLSWRLGQGDNDAS